ncbi:MAG: hypothetical protein N4Q30_06645, partial [Neisseriaceae bacterium]|nr:hypothetical protein [Neisseriaceae bacterium]
MKIKEEGKLAILTLLFSFVNTVSYSEEVQNNQQILDERMCVEGESINCEELTNYIIFLNGLLAVTNLALTFSDDAIFEPKLAYPDMRQYVLRKTTVENTPLTQSITLSLALSSQVFSMPLSSTLTSIPFSLIPFSLSITPVSSSLSLPVTLSSSLKLGSFALLSSPISLSSNPSLWPSSGPSSAILSLVSHPVYLSSKVGSMSLSSVSSNPGSWSVSLPSSIGYPFYSSS